MTPASVQVQYTLDPDPNLNNNNNNNSNGCHHQHHNQAHASSTHENNTTINTTEPIHKQTYIIHHPLPWPSLFTPRTHTRSDIVRATDEAFFLHQWPFRSDKQRQKFLDMDFARWSVRVCAGALDERIQIYARFITVLFLIDDMLDGMSHEEGRRYTDHIAQQMRSKDKTSASASTNGHNSASDNNSENSDDNTKNATDIAAQTLTTLFREIEATDEPKANDLYTHLVHFWNAQTDPTRGAATANLEEYLEFRIIDIGHFVSTSLGLWAIKSTIPSHEMLLISQINRNIGDHTILVNDLFSWDKELLHAAQMNSDIVNAVRIVMRSQGVDEDAAKEVLARRVRAVEERHFELVGDSSGISDNGFDAGSGAANRSGGKAVAAVGDGGGRLSVDSQQFIRFLTTLAAGNESWSRETARYNIENGRQVKPKVENISFRALEVDGPLTFY